MGKARKQNAAKENAAALNEPINFRERMIMTMREIRYVSLSPFYDNNSNNLLPARSHTLSSESESSDRSAHGTTLYLMP